MSAAEVALLPQLQGLVVYDQILTLPDEIEHIWRRKVNIVNLLFFANRFALISWTAVQIYANLSFRTTSSSEPAPALLQTTIGCGIALNLDTVMQILISLIQAVFIGLRLYALSGRKWTLCVIICAFSLLPGQLTFQFRRILPRDRSPWSQYQEQLLEGVVTIWTLIGSSVLALADLVAQQVTIRLSQQFCSETWGTLSFEPVQGILHFAILFFLNAASAIPSVIQSDVFVWVSDILLMFQVPYVTQYSLDGVLTSYFQRLEAIIVSHFLLDLRGAAYIRTDYDTVDVDQVVDHLTLNGGLGTRQSSLKFAAFVVPMGGSLGSGSYGESDDDESDESDSGHSADDTRAVAATASIT
ncbi:hypothetical protein CERSUDRAFT_74919 [Gelatoporia subvermispora B]|uniref:DUF6533 domain-containing protein n=1 Tax=Ceriporiopsis subvermispora (strain B) TaxID=914234 RepID=M2RA26_CERS8|nr:hypothetical protein CERSUDRAFT_74919 [Gelatoporia subvermispora B]